MSFSSSVKNELCRHSIINEAKCCSLAELAAAFRTGGIPGQETGELLRMITENAAFTRRMFSIMKHFCSITPKIISVRNTRLRKRTTYNVVVVDTPAAEFCLLSSGVSMSKKGSPDSLPVYMPWLSANRKKSAVTCCRKAYLRGAFLMAGSVSNPEKTYHLEITSHDRNIALELRSIMKGFGLKARIAARKGYYVIYLKEGEDIVDFLNITGAHSSLLELENIRILKEMRNNVNRIVNCETANLGKTVEAALRQSEDIRYIIDNRGIEAIPEELREIAAVRISHPEASLKELGEMLGKQLGKSGVSHRLAKISEIAEKLRQD
ncbi:MAG: DNA-binding protein WhiA [Eubacteriales bacterium]|nr:DNA-binding protein WhiA [Eubacteriales bacterium]